jgi:phage gpG-like protein
MDLTIDDFAAELDDITRRVDKEPVNAALEKCRNLVLCDIADNFAKSMSPNGEAWPPRKIEGDGHPLLIETSALLDAATGNGAGSIDQLEGRMLELGVDGSIIPYAATHNFGDPGRNIPQREFAGAQEATLEECAEILAEEMLKRLWK